MLLCCLTTAPSFAENNVSLQEVIQQAEQGNATAQYRLGVMYADGISGTSQNYLKALKWIKKSAEQGNIKAQCTLGIMYYHGYEIPQNFPEAFKWFKKAADQKSANAQYSLGAMYFNGDWVRQNYQEAVKWFKKAADQGHQQALSQLASFSKNFYNIQEDASPLKKKGSTTGISDWKTFEALPQYKSLTPAQKERAKALYREVMGPNSISAPSSEQALSIVPDWQQRKKQQAFSASQSEGIIVNTNQEIYGDNWLVLFLLSVIFTWCIGLAPPIFTRFFLIKHPVSKRVAWIFVITFWFLNIFFFTLLGSKSKSHGALSLIALISYVILRKGAIKYEMEQKKDSGENKKTKSDQRQL